MQRTREQLEELISFINRVENIYRMDVLGNPQIYICKCMIDLMKHTGDVRWWLKRFDQEYLWERIASGTFRNNGGETWYYVHHLLREILPEFNPITCLASNPEAIQAYKDGNYTKLARTLWWRLDDFEKADDLRFARVNALNIIKESLLKELNAI